MRDLSVPGPSKEERRVLMTAFHFPPQSTSSGVQRTLGFARHLGAQGWQPLVLTAHPRAYAEKSPSQLADMPKGLVVQRAFTLDAKRHLGIKGRYFEACALPDRWASWWLGAVPAGLNMIRVHRPQVLWSTFPIATAHLVGMTLHRLTRLPWVADFRDPMLQAGYPVSRPQRHLLSWIERLTIERCSAAVFTTQGAMSACTACFPALAYKFHVIENGYDEQDFGSAIAHPNARLTLVHSGALYATGRDPSPFFEALAMLKSCGEIDAVTTQVVMRAPGDCKRFGALAASFEVNDVVAVEPALPYGMALQEMVSADGLIVLQGTNFNAQLPAKVYEYFRARKPILAVVDIHGETARMLRSAGFDAIADINDSAQIAPVMATWLQQIRVGRARIASDHLIASSSRLHRTHQLVEILTRVARHGA